MNKFIALFLLSAAGLLSACVAMPSTDESASVTVPAPIIIQKQPDIIVVAPDHAPKKTSVHVCQINAFTHTYSAEDESRGKAKLKAKKQCLANFHDMHCPDEKITCTEYQ